MKRLSVIFSGGLVSVTILISLIYITTTVLMSCDRLCDIQKEIQYQKRSYEYFQSELRGLLEGDSHLANNLISEDEFDVVVKHTVNHGFECFNDGANMVDIEKSTLKTAENIIFARLDSVNGATRVELSEDITDLLVETLTYWDEDLPRYDEFIELTQFLSYIVNPVFLVAITIIGILCIIGLWTTHKERKEHFPFVLFISFFIAGATLLLVFFSIHEITYYEPSTDLNVIRKHYVQAIANEISQQLYELGSLIMMISIGIFGVTTLIIDMGSTLANKKSSF